MKVPGSPMLVSRSLTAYLLVGFLAVPHGSWPCSKKIGRAEAHVSPRQSSSGQDLQNTDRRCWALQTRLATGSAWICRVGSAWLSSVGMQLLRRDWSKTCWASVLQLPQQKCDGALNSRIETWRRLESAPALISQRRRISCMAKNGLGGAVGSLGCCLLRIPSEATNFGTSALSLRDLATL